MLTESYILVTLAWQLVPDIITHCKHLLIQDQVSRGKRLIELFWLAGTDNRRGNSRLGQYPGYGELSHCEMMLMTKRFQLLNRLYLCLLPVACLIELPGILHRKTCTLLRSLPGLIAPREQTAGKWIIADDSYALIN